MNWYQEKNKKRDNDDDSPRKGMFDWSLQCCGQPSNRRKDPYNKNKNKKEAQALWETPYSETYEVSPEEYNIEDAKGYYPDFQEDDAYMTQTEGHFEGRHIIWIADESKVEWAEVDDIYPREDNIFDANKYASLRNHLEQLAYHGEKMYLHAPFAYKTVVEPINIQESVEYADTNSHRILTSGDAALDQYIMERDDYPDEDMEEELREAIEYNYGDLGRVIYQIRDGNHRAFAARDSGEDRIPLTIIG